MDKTIPKHNVKPDLSSEIVKIKAKVQTDYRRLVTEEMRNKLHRKLQKDRYRNS